MTEFVVNHIMDGFLLTAFPIAVLAGIISFISPCVLPLVPGYLAFAAGFSNSRGKLFLGSVLFVLGFSALFISYGVLFGELGARVAVNEEIITRVLGVLTILMGVIFLGAFPMMPTIKPKISTNGGLIGAPILGFLFGVGWTPCIGPALASVQALAFQESSAVRGAVLSFGTALDSASHLSHPVYSSINLRSCAKYWLRAVTKFLRWVEHFLSLLVFSN